MVLLLQHQLLHYGWLTRWLGLGDLGDSQQQQQCLLHCLARSLQSLLQ